MTELPPAGVTPTRSRTGRAAEREAFRAARAGDFDPAALALAMAERLAEDAAEAPAAAPAAAVGAARVFAVGGNTRRWVPIGPSVVLRGGPVGTFPRATGRVRDLRVSGDGRRAYAASAKGGLWYSEDGGALWSPVGGWAARPGTVGGSSNAQACGCLDVDFGADAAGDFVMVGTGELQGFSRAPIRPALGGVGVLAARGPVTSVGAGGDPWEPETGLAVLEGLGSFALARDPAATPGRPAGAGLDRVLLGTSRGLFLGVRRPAGPPPGGEFTWTLLPALEPFMGAGRQPLVTDVRWVPGGANGRIVVALALGLETADAPAPVGSGVAVSDDLGVTFHWVTGLDPTAAVAEPGIGRMSFAQPAPSRLYVLGERHRTLPPVADLASVWRLDPTAAAPAAALLTGVPAVWFRLDSGKNQRDYDQAIAVDPVTAATDRLYLAGNFVDRSAGPLQSSQPASVWCLEVPVAGTALVPAPGISRSGPVAAGGDGASPAGLIGDDIHPDVHTIRFAGAAPNRQVWVTTDGGVFLSTRAGRVNSFAPRSTGLAALEANFVAPHPTSSQYVAAGMQDNGRHVRRGDVVWVDTKGGDGGGVVFHPVASQVILSQFTSAGWSTDPAAGFVDPLDQGGGAGEGKREFEQSAFYSGTAAVIRAPSATRVVIGTNRVWLTEDLAVADPCTWKALPFPSGVPTNPRPGGSDPPAKQNVGVPAGGPLPAIAGGVGPLRKVITQKWASPTSLLVVFERGVVRWTFAAGTWTARVLVPGVAGAPDPAKTLLSDVAPVPGTSDFYLVTTGDTAGPPGETCLFFHDASSAFFPTGLRAQLAPLDPAYASVVDPGAPADVYVGTVTGVWRGTRGAGPPAPGADWPHTWGALVNGLPQAAVQDLSVWHDPAGPPRLLRAAMQSRGIWELDLAKPDEPERTYVKVHPHDDRRRLPTPMKDPRRAPAAPDVAGFASPDILVRPRPMVGIDPAWPLAAGATVSGPGGMPPYQLWTFQTAFRWLFPSVTADGEWSAPFGQMVALHRSTVPALGPAVPRIDKPLWDAVVGGLRVSPAGVVPGGGGDPLAVYRAPWATAIVPDAVATELDLHEHVVLPVVGDVAQVFAELSTVDVLIHHRDIRELSPGSAFALLFWQSAPGAAALLGLDTNPVRDYALAVAGGGAVPAAAPAGWRVVLNGAGDPRHTLPVALDARMPRAVPIELNLTGESGNRVLLLAVVGSDVDPCTDLGVGLPAPAPPPPPPPPARPTVTPVDLARRWPYAAVRQLSVSPR